MRNPRARKSTQALSERARTAAEAQARSFGELVRLLEADAQELTERLEVVEDKRKELVFAASPSAGELSAKSRPP
jgi:hypothetical protein